ncbi:MAG TPA: hypothetical protein VK625_01100 [Flavitalea sp.]|nr:hypothetical protein [Flavitalea sp.]
MAYGSSEGLHVFGETDYYHGVGKLFFSKAIPEGNYDFEIYLDERQKEINRLKAIIGKQKGYANKLKCFIEARAGQPRFESFELKVENNDYEKFIANGGGTVPDHLLGNTTEIDLRPSTSDERKCYNLYLYNYVQELIKQPEKFHWLLEVSYKGFLISPAFEAFKKQMQKAFNPTSALATEIRRVEDKFYVNSITNYIENLYPYQVKDIGFWQMSLFNAFLNGYDFDFGRKQLTEHEIQALIHVEHALEYYKQLHELKDTNSKRRKPAVETLTPEQIKARFTSQFEREVENAKIPFNNLIDKESSFKNDLLNEYLMAEIKPCLDFFLAEHYSKEEIEAGFKEVHNRIPVSKSKDVVAAGFVADTPFESHFRELIQEFNEMLVKKTLAAKYYCPDLEKTAIVRTLREINAETEILKRSIFDEKTDKYKEAEIRAKNVSLSLEKLDRFANLVLAEVKNDRENFHLYLKGESLEQRSFWEALKSNFNNSLTMPAVSQSKSVYQATHREVMFAHHFKVETGEALYKNAGDWYKERKGRSKIEFGTTMKKKNSNNYEEPTEKELTKIVELLESFKAQKIAINKLNALRK